MTDTLNRAVPTQYSDSSVRVPHYRYSRIALSNLSSGVVPFQPTTSAYLEWKLSAATVYNLSRSYITYQYQLPGGGAGLYGVVQENGLDFRSVQFQNQGGLSIVDAQFADVLAHTFRPITTPIQEFKSKDQLSQFYPCRQLNTTNLMAADRTGLTAGTENAGTDPYDEPQYLNISPTANTPINVYRQIPLNSLKKTFFAQDQDIVFGTDMWIRIYTNFLQRMCFYTTTPNNPSVTANATAVTASINASNVYLYLAIEKNEDLVNNLLASLASGRMKLTIPWMYTYRSSAAGLTNTTCNVTYSLSKSFGRGVKSITFVPYNANELSPLAYDKTNCNGTKISSYVTALNSVNLTDQYNICFNPYSTILPVNTPWGGGVIPATWADDYRENEKYLKGSCLNGYSSYQTNWFHTDSWGVLPLTEKTPFQPGAIVDSFDLTHTGDAIYTLNANCPGITNTNSNCNTSGLVVYVFIEFLRTLIIAPDGIALQA